MQTAVVGRMQQNVDQVPAK